MTGKRGNWRKRARLKRWLMQRESACWLGLEPLDFGVSDPNDPRHVEIDEEIPVSLGGDPLDRANCHLVCRRHNLMKGNKVLPRGFYASRPRKRGTSTSREW